MRGRVCVWMDGGVHGSRVCIPGGGCGWGDMHGRGPCVAVGGGDMHAGETTTEAGGTHPTGMNSCYLL